MPLNVYWTFDYAHASYVLYYALFQFQMAFCLIWDIVENILRTQWKVFN